MTCCCYINELSPCTVDEAVKMALIDGGIATPIHTGGLAHQDGTDWPLVVLELLQPTSAVSNGCCWQYTASLKASVYSTTKQDGISLAKEVQRVLKANQIMESQVGNVVVFRSTLPQQVTLPDGIFITRAIFSLVIYTPK